MKTELYRNWFGLYVVKRGWRRRHFWFFADALLNFTLLRWPSGKL